MPCCLYGLLRRFLRFLDESMKKYQPLPCCSDIYRSGNPVRCLRAYLPELIILQVLDMRLVDLIQAYLLNQFQYPRQARRPQQTV